MNKNYKKFILYLASAALPMALVCALFFYNGITPFGEKSLLTIDMQGQYVSYFAYFKELIFGNSDWIYSFSKSFGGDMQGFIAYYLMSPLNLILCFFKTENLPVAMSFLSIIKIGLCGLASFTLFTYKSEYKIQNLIFSTFYSLMAYNLAFIQTPIWLDSVIILPIIIIGIEKILSGKSALLYILSLSYAIITNYYIGFMVCIFSGLFFLYRWLISPSFKAIVTFIFSSILSGALGAFVILPAFKSLDGSAKGISDLGGILSLETMFKMIDFIKSMVLPPAFTMENHTNGMPNVYIGFGLLVLVAIYFISKKISFKEKILSFIFVSFMVLSFYFKGLFLIWHGFSHPVWFWHRNSFLFSFLLIYIAFRGFEALSNGKFSRVIIIGVSAVNLAAVLFYAQSVIAFNGNGDLLLTEYVNRVQPVISDIKSSDDSLYRIEKTFSFNNNDSMLLGYNGLSHFSTGEKTTTRKIMLRAGYDSVEQYSSYNDGSTISNDSLFGVKYILSEYPLTQSLKLLNKVNGVYVYENPYALPLLFEANNNVSSFDIQDLTPSSFSSSFASAVLGSPVTLENVLEFSDEQLRNADKSVLRDNIFSYTASGESPQVEFTFYSPKDGSVWLYCFSDIFPQEVAISVNNGTPFEYFSLASRGNVYIGEFKEGEKITVTFSFMGSEMVCSYPELILTDTDALFEFSGDINRFKLTDFTQSRFSGEIEILKENSGLLTTLPYEIGWHAIVDGNKVTPVVAANSFLYLPLEKGMHTIEFKFVPVGMKAGYLITVLGLILLTFGVIKRWKSKLPLF